ncbi:hypothetical protein O988_07835 [Pseudogymnoascus sp. VKM F-3808]|nr:hypothetical protein O988_07835 [Pseudogymnoascus sp. VKM F-3808]
MPMTRNISRATIFSVTPDRDTRDSHASEPRRLGVECRVSPEPLLFSYLDTTDTTTLCRARRAPLFPMFLLFLLRNVLFFLLVPFSLVSTTYLYYYPLFHGCAFPTPGSSIFSNAFVRTVLSHTPLSPAVSTTSPFRLLAVGDPQLEGSSSLDPTATDLTNFHAFLDVFNSTESLLQRTRSALHANIDFWLDDLPRLAKYGIKRLDLWGNDLYLAHVYRTVRWWSRPTHVTVLGDLLGSQWIDDEEFEWRSGRFWDRVFPDHEKISDDLIHTTRPPIALANGDQEPRSKPFHTIGEDAQAWSTRLMNVAGNHDIGYGGDLTLERAARFERAFGRLNYALEFRLPSAPDAQQQAPTLRVVVLNNMNLDTPVYAPKLQTDTYDFINSVVGESYPVEQSGIFTIVLTHIPLHKVAGVCSDGPLFDFHESGENGSFPHGIREQNHLSDAASRGVLESIFGKSSSPIQPGGGRGRRGIVLTGHDHEGCDVYHFINQSSPEPIWEARRWPVAQAQGIPSDSSLPGLREVTVRSVMGDFSGNLGLMSLWLDEAGEWQSGYADCRAVRAWVWWVVHVVDCIAVAVTAVWGLVEFYASSAGAKASKRRVNGVARAGIRAAGMRGRSLSSDRRDAGNNSGSDTATLSSGQKKSLRRKRSKQSMREDLGAGKRQLSDVLEVPE